MIIHPRAHAGLNPVVKSANRVTRRPLLRDGLDLVICHHPGVRRQYLGMSPEQVAAAIRGIDRWMANEYNYVLHPTGIWEFAGHYQAAHARGYNDRSYGVLFLIGIDEQLPDVMVEQYRHLFGALAWSQRIKPTAWSVPHGWLAKTACPGNVLKRWSELERPLG